VTEGLGARPGWALTCRYPDGVVGVHYRRPDPAQTSLTREGVFWLAGSPLDFPLS
jgi:hypothetical protein